LLFGHGVKRIGAVWLKPCRAIAFSGSPDPECVGVFVLGRWLNILSGMALNRAIQCSISEIGITRRMVAASVSE